MRTRLSILLLTAAAMNAAFAQSAGKSAPAWHISEARGVEKSAKLEDYRGKWVIVDFWGFW